MGEPKGMMIQCSEELVDSQNSQSKTTNQISTTTTTTNNAITQTTTTISRPIKFKFKLPPVPYIVSETARVLSWGQLSPNPSFYGIHLFAIGWQFERIHKGRLYINEVLCSNDKPLFRTTTPEGNIYESSNYCETFRQLFGSSIEKKSANFFGFSSLKIIRILECLPEIDSLIHYVKRSKPIARKPKYLQPKDPKIPKTNSSQEPINLSNPQIDSPSNTSNTRPKRATKEIENLHLTIPTNVVDLDSDYEQNPSDIEPSDDDEIGDEVDEEEEEEKESQTPRASPRRKTPKNQQSPPKNQDSMVVQSSSSNVSPENATPTISKQNETQTQIQLQTTSLLSSPLPNGKPTQSLAEEIELLKTPETVNDLDVLNLISLKLQVPVRRLFEIDENEDVISLQPQQTETKQQQSQRTENQQALIQIPSSTQTKMHHDFEVVDAETVSTSTMQQHDQEREQNSAKRKLENENHLENVKRTKMNQDLGSQTQNTIVTTQPKIRMPWKLNDSLAIVSLGEISNRPGFHTKEFIFPIGYKIVRLFGTTSHKFPFTAEILGGPLPVFRVTDGLGRVYEDARSWKVWEDATGTNVPVSYFMGFDRIDVMKALESLPNSGKLFFYVPLEQRTSVSIKQPAQFMEIDVENQFEIRADGFPEAPTATIQNKEEMERAETERRIEMERIRKERSTLFAEREKLERQFQAQLQIQYQQISERLKESEKEWEKEREKERKKERKRERERENEKQQRKQRKQQKQQTPKTSPKSDQMKNKEEKTTSNNNDAINDDNHDPHDEDYEEDEDFAYWESRKKRKSTTMPTTRNSPPKIISLSEWNVEAANFENKNLN